MVEQRPFKALVLGSSPSQPTFLFRMAWVYMIRGYCGRHYIGSTGNLDRRLAEHQRGKVHSTRRFGQPLELVASREMPDMQAARILERELKAKKDPQVAIYLLKDGPDR
jgi:predicted GIY-YIG superfamily endonuclease